MNLATYFIDSVKNRGYGSVLVQAVETPRGAPALGPQRQGRWVCPHLAVGTAPHLCHWSGDGLSSQHFFF